MQGIAREACFPAVFELLDISYTGGDPSLLSVCHDFSEANGEHNIYDYDMKQTDEGVKGNSASREAKEQSESLNLEF